MLEKRFGKFLPLLAAALFLALAAPFAKAAPLSYVWGEIATDTVWSGEVLIEGQTVVKKGATLTIEPGTVIKFVYTDKDDNHIGDGELNCEGLLIARGTKEKPILFTSAKTDPKMKDWTYVMVSVNKDAVIENCIFEYAFSGIQVHYSTGTFKDNLFRYNYEGIRFSTTHVVIEHNDFLDNAFGVKFESRGSKTIIRNNKFRGNECAFFPVQKSTPLLKIYDNDIGAGECGVKFGYGQFDDLNFTNNWWGSDDPKVIQKSFYDRNVDPELGVVVFDPFLKAPPEAGRR